MNPRVNPYQGYIVQVFKVTTKFKVTSKFRAHQLKHLADNHSFKGTILDPAISKIFILKESKISHITVFDHFLSSLIHVAMATVHLEGEFLHQEVDVRINLEPMQVVGVALQPHQQAAVRDVSRQSA